MSGVPHIFRSGAVAQVLEQWLDINLSELRSQELDFRCSPHI